jgi:hypothetical protein
MTGNAAVATLRVKSGFRYTCTTPRPILSEATSVAAALLDPSSTITPAAMAPTLCATDRRFDCAFIVNLLLQVRLILGTRPPAKGGQGPFVGQG